MLPLDVHGNKIHVSWLTSVTKVSTIGRPAGFGVDGGEVGPWQQLADGPTGVDGWPPAVRHILTKNDGVPLNTAGRLGMTEVIVRGRRRSCSP